MLSTTLVLNLTLSFTARVTYLPSIPDEHKAHINAMETTSFVYMILSLLNWCYLSLSFSLFSPFNPLSPFSNVGPPTPRQNISGSPKRTLLLIHVNIPLSTPSPLGGKNPARVYLVDASVGEVEWQSFKLQNSLSLRGENVLPVPKSALY